MSIFLNEGGWGMLPVLLCGGLAFLLSLLFAISLRREVLPLLGGFWMATLLTGCLGFVAGFSRTIAYVEAHPPIDLRILVEGLRESLNCLIAGLVLAILAAVPSGAGGFRLAWRAAARS